MNSRNDSGRLRRMRHHVANLGSDDMEVASQAESRLIRHYLDIAFDDLMLACASLAPQVRFMAVWALAYTRDSRAFNTILGLTDDVDERVRYDATIALGILSDDRAVDPLIDMLLANDETRPAGAALSRLGPHVADRLLGALERGCADVRIAAVNVLGGFVADYNDVVSKRILLGLTDDQEEQVRQEANWWLTEGATLSQRSA